ncbi:AraC family transcriptional regulator [Lederbergia citrea]|uniref:AraC family transcriptional regulator n=1 Tax=Lederbergia citrea TaxID=2833581 RepID=A0A942UKQ3_9BACI|nr:AraC family transcriptional regulator [Lederbergia citrea]MBS4178221.1 AraC family transcriptional regulator [Lederbergia citrea]MBS4204898.1 AraC family transcriptional regulator [Lederbergia citrea]MBS4223251.1 AraC family transcriptional regulator [Lederbergia citrea]
MKPLAKSIDTNNTLPLHIVFKDTKQPDHELPDHVHDWHEIVYVYRGKGTFFIDQYFYDVNEGDIFILPANTIHRAVPDSDIPITSTAIFFHPSTLIQSPFMRSFAFARILEESKKEKEYRFSIPENMKMRIERFLEEMEAECNHSGVDSSEALLLLLHMLLLDLNRHCLKLQENTVNHEPEWLKKSLLYIDEHIGDNLDLLTIAHFAAVSSAHFSRVFKELVGLNLTDYITAKRLILAKEMLLATNEPIHAIANQSGYKSMPHFYRTFKKITGLTPKEYRKQK